MLADRYVKVILTIIAVELLWLGARAAAPPVLAQPGPNPVVITGFRFGGQDYATLPVAVVGSARMLPGGRELPNLDVLSIRVTQAPGAQPLSVLVGNQPITVQTGTRPLLVDAVAKAGARPGM